jgi:hypothetical protein
MHLPGEIGPSNPAAFIKRESNPVILRVKPTWDLRYVRCVSNERTFETIRSEQRSRFFPGFFWSPIPTGWCYPTPSQTLLWGGLFKTLGMRAVTYVTTSL